MCPDPRVDQVQISRAVLGLAFLAMVALPSGSRALGLSEYVTDVLETNPLVREQLHAYRQVGQDYQIALSGWRPSLDMQASVGRFSRKAPNTSQEREDFNSSEATLTLAQNLFDGFETTHQVKQARARIASAVYRLYDTADNVSLDAIRAYLDVLEERQLVELAKQNVESHERILAQILERNRAGIGLLSEVVQTEGRVARAHASLVAQQNNLRDSLTRIHEFLGRYVDPDNLAEPAALPEPAKGFQELTDEALAKHPAIQSAAKNIEASRSDYRRAKSSNYPTLDLQVQQNLASNLEGIDGDTDERGIQFVLRYNLFRGGADLAEQRKRISVLHEDKAFLDRVRRQVMDTLGLAWAGDRAIREQVPYLRTHVEKARKTLETYHEEFLINLRDLIDLLDAENELNTARIRLTEAHYAALAARFRVYEGIGDLLPALGLTVDLSDDNLRVASLEAQGLDEPEPTTDRDRDNLPDRRDQCDNSSEAAGLDDYGCIRQPSFELGYPGIGHAPEAVDDQIELQIAAQEAIVIPPEVLLINDNDADGDQLSVLGFTQPIRGSLSEDEDGNLVYAPPTGFAGVDEFGYTVGDGRSRSATAKVSVRIGPVSSYPEVEVVRFVYKKSTLTEQSQVRLDAMAERLLRHPGATVDVYTYTDNIGSASYNRRLSESRAEVIRQLFIDRGIEADRINAYGRGENNPIADNSTEEGRAQNRRAEIKLVLPSSE